MVARCKKNPLFFTMWGMAKATDTPVLVGKPRSPENGRKVKVQENPQNLFKNKNGIFCTFAKMFSCPGRSRSK